MSNFYRQLRSMGTRLEIVIPGLDEKTGLQLSRRISESLEQLVQRISNYDSNSEISLVNRNAYRDAVNVSDSLGQLIKFGIEGFQNTGGFFDFTLGGWTSIPDLIRDTEGSFEKLKRLPLSERISLDGNTLRLLHKDVRLDSGGMGKGQGLLLIKNILNEMDIRSAFISFGGSSVLGVGKHPYGDSWKVGIQHPGKESEIIDEIELRDQVLSVSGNSTNNRKKYGEEGHILNPESGVFLKAPEIVMVITEHPVEAEIASTALAAAGKEKQEKITENLKNLIFKRIDY